MKKKIPVRMPGGSRLHRYGLLRLNVSWMGLTAAVLGTASAICNAQSSLTLFGVVDTSVSHYSTTGRQLSDGVTATRSQWALSNSALDNSRLGFRGTEDLGGGLAAGFWLEAPIRNDDGSQGIANFSRRSTVSLPGGFGEVRLGRDYTPSFWSDTIFDPFPGPSAGNSAIALVSAQLSNGKTDTWARTSNAVGYFLPPDLGGFYGQLQYAFHENVKTQGVVSNTGQYAGGRFGYMHGPLDVALAYGQSITADTPLGYDPSTRSFTGLDRRVRTFNLGASYDFGPVKLLAEVSRLKERTKMPSTLSWRSTTDTYNGYLLGASVPIGAGRIRTSYSQVDLKNGALTGADASVRKLALDYVYNLSKRTALYATASHVSIKNAQNSGVLSAISAGGALGYSFTAQHSTGYDHRRG